MAPVSRGEKRKREPQSASEPQPDASKTRGSRAVQPASLRPNKRRRSSREQNRPRDGDADQSQNDSSAPRLKSKKQKSRPPLSAIATGAGPEEDAAAKVPGRRGRPRKSSPKSTAEQPPTATEVTSKRKRSRLTLSEVAVPETQNRRNDDADSRAPPKTSSGRPKRPRLSEKPSKDTNGTNTTNTRRARASNSDPPRPVEAPNRNTQIEAQRSRRPRNATQGDVDVAANGEAADAQEDNDGRYRGPQYEEEFQYITEKTVTVSMSKILSKWRPLDSTSMAAIHEILLDAQKPVLYQLRNGRNRQEHASSILTAITNRIQRKLAKGVPFPPPMIGRRLSTAVSENEPKSGTAQELDYERVVDAAQALEDQLNPTLHSIALLQAEVRRQEKALDEEYKNLRSLETNARNEARSWKKSMRTTHVLVPESPISQAGFGHDDSHNRWNDVELVVPDRQPHSLDQSLEEEDLVKLSQQIGSHMESMRTNLAQIDGVLSGMVNSKAALHEVLLKHLDPAQCDRILLG